MFKKAEVRLEDGFSFGKTGWVVIVIVKDGVLGEITSKVGGLHFTSRKDAIKTYRLVESLIKALE